MEVSREYRQSKSIKYITLAFETFSALLLTVGSWLLFINAFGISMEIFRSGGIREGGLTLWNAFAETLGMNNYILLPVYDADSGSPIIAYFIIAVTLVISFFVVRSKNRYLLTLYAVPVFVFCVILNLEVSEEGLSILIVAIIYSWFVMRKNGTGNLHSLGLVCIVSLIAGAIYITPFFTDHLCNFEQTSAVKAKVTDKITDVRYGRGKTKNSDTALTITMKKPAQMWLRGFTGEEHIENEWKAMPNDRQYQYAGVHRSLSENWLPMTQVTKADETAFDKKEKTSRVEIELKRSGREYIFLPYEVAEYSESKVKNYGDSFLKAKGLTGQSKYEFRVGDEATSRWTDLAGKYYEGYGKQSKRRISYETEESHINLMAYSRFTDLNDEDINAAYNAVGDYEKKSEGHIDYDLAIKSVKKYFNDDCLILNKKNAKPGASLDELVQGKKLGYGDAANLAAVLFRYYGIPARYVEGYQLRPSDVKKMKPNKPYNLKCSRAWQWPEIYVDGIGWMPIEINPGAEGNMKQADLTKGLEGQSISNPIQEQPPRPSGNTQSGKVKEPDSINWKKILMYVIGCAFLILLVLLLFLIGRKAYRYRKMVASFGQKDVRRAICSLFAALSERKIRLDGELTDIGYRAAYSTEEVFEGERRKMWERWKERRRYKSN